MLQLQLLLFMKLMPKNCLLDCHTKHSRPILSFVNSHSAFVLIAPFSIQVLASSQLCPPRKGQARLDSGTLSSHCAAFRVLHSALDMTSHCHAGRKWKQATQDCIRRRPPLILEINFHEVPIEQNFENFPIEIQMHFYSLFDIPALILF